MSMSDDNHCPPMETAGESSTNIAGQTLLLLPYGCVDLLHQRPSLASASAPAVGLANLSFPAGSRDIIK